MVLTEDQAEWLRKESFLKRKSMSLIVRELINYFRSSKDAKEVDEPTVPAQENQQF